MELKQSSGWALYDSQGEYGRMGLPNAYWKHTSINMNYEVGGALFTFSVLVTCDLDSIVPRLFP